MHVILALLVCCRRNDFGGSRRPHQDSQRTGSYGDVPPFPDDPLRLVSVCIAVALCIRCEFDSCFGFCCVMILRKLFGLLCPVFNQWRHSVTGKITLGLQYVVQPFNSNAVYWATVSEFKFMFRINFIWHCSKQCPGASYQRIDKN